MTVFSIVCACFCVAFVIEKLKREAAARRERRRLQTEAAARKERKIRDDFKRCKPGSPPTQNGGTR